MMRLALGIAMQFCVAISAQADKPRWLLNADGLGPVRIGMHVAEVNRVLPATITPSPVGARVTPDCDYQNIPSYPGLSLVFIDDKVARIDVTAPGIRSINGTEVGQRERDVASRLPEGKWEKLDHVDSGKSLLVTKPGQHHALSFQFEDQRLVRIIAGSHPVIDYAEGCE
ncbi:hypothetical protein [Massilia endophytica]|uniref:hypothetical protein n=1 Tax=Massilia endophytica TaxID=2899220 RepID=UPI001E3A23EF|nr:hypothetical protein [Massilia endophytica]UGQ46397.1 hypothetical protein LSQ66_21955 [Massilia endophytica]